MEKPALSDRKLQLLTLLIERYIRDGQPVASKSLAEDTGRSMSPATIRHVMADLEEGGYIQSPHTSAGRVPTEQGYRLFVDNLLTSRTIKPHDIEKLPIDLEQSSDTSELLHTASDLLSNMTHLAGLVTIPKHNQVKLRHVEFLPLSENRVLAILVFNQQDVQNRIIETKRHYSASELQQAANFINAHYTGQELMQVRKQLLHAMQQDRQQMNELMKLAVEMADKAFQQESEKKDYVMAGQSNLFDLADMTGIQRLRKLFDAFTKKQGVLYLLDKCLQSEGIQIFIGKESGYDVFNDLSIVTSPYYSKGEVVGMLGVIGPTRMPYHTAISAVDMTARLLTAAMEK